MLVGDRHGGIAGERRFSGQHFIQHATGGIQIGAHVDAFAARLLWRQILRGADHALGLRHRGRGVVKRTGDAEVHDLDHALLGNHDVSRLDVSVNHTHAMRILECVQYADHHLLGVTLAQGAVHLENIAQSLPLDILHDQIWQMFDLAALSGHDLLSRIVDVHDVRVVHLRHGVSFTAETLKEDGVVGKIGAHDLDCHSTPETCVMGHVDLGHAATTNQLPKLITATSQRGGHVDTHPYSFQSVLTEIWGLLDTRRGILPPTETTTVSASCVCWSSRRRSMRDNVRDTTSAS